LGKLILIRHGHTALNGPGDEERLRGWLDVPLDEQGVSEARNIALRLSQVPIEALFCSDLRRARRTAEIIGKRTKVPITATDELRPWDIGVFAGQPIREVVPFLELLGKQPGLSAPSGESFHEFFERYSRRLAALLEEAEKTPKHVVAVAHYRNLVAGIAIMSGGNRDSVPMRGGPPTGSFVVFERTRGKWTIGSPDTIGSPADRAAVLARVSMTQASARGKQWLRS
jgi:broad specificity phosphatase PhoE